MPRLDIERQRELEPKRIEYAKQQIKSLGYDITLENGSEIHFEYKGNTIKLFPYSGWHQGKGITPGRGLNKLLKQIK